MSSLLIRGGRVIDPANSRDEQADVLVRDGKIAEIGKGLAQADRVIDASNQIVVPGLIDIHVHLREPGQEHKETIASGTYAAASGGFASVCCMPNTVPVNDTGAVTELILQRAREAANARVYAFGAITRGLEGRQLSEFAELKAAGAIGFTDDGKCVMDTGLMRRAFEYAATFDLPILQHCEDHSLSLNGAMHEGRISVRNGLTAQPAQAESIIVNRDIELVELTGARYHALHLSTIASLRHIREAKRRGLPVTCEVMPHHFSLTDEACLHYDTSAKVNPPLRGQEHVDAVKEAIADGTADAIATDHAPHATVDKEVEFGCAAFGISSVETAVPLCLDLWREKLVSLQRIVELLTIGPAKVMRLPGGTLSHGSAADITIVDTDLSWEVTEETLKSKGKNTPLLGKTMRGAATHTIVDGRVVFARENG